MILNLEKMSFCTSSVLSDEAKTNNWPTLSSPYSSVNFMYPFQSEIQEINELLLPDLLVDAYENNFATRKLMAIKEISDIFV